MKKTVAVAIGIFFIAMGTMFVWGFIDKQSKESASNSAANNTPASTQPSVPSNSTSTSGSTTDTSQTSNSSTITSAEVAKHKTPSDCWMSIDSGVYNVTNYVDMHPGGADIVLMYCGKDATQAYNTQGGRGRGHSSRARALLENYKVGNLQ